MGEVMQGPVGPVGRRALTDKELADRIRMRLPSIESTVRLVTANGELADYDDECANDLHFAVEWLKLAAVHLSAKSE